MDAMSQNSNKMGGILPAHVISRMIAQGELKLARPADSDQIQPASLDMLRRRA